MLIQVREGSLIALRKLKKGVKRGEMLKFCEDLEGDNGTSIGGGDKRRKMMKKKAIKDNGSCSESEISDD